LKKGIKMNADAKTEPMGDVSLRDGCGYRSDERDGENCVCKLGTEEGNFVLCLVVWNGVIKRSVEILAFKMLWFVLSECSRGWVNLLSQNAA
jgi:hypothetical protein